MTGAKARSKSTDESVKKLKAQLQSYMISNDSRIDELGNKIDKLLEKMIAPQGGILGSAPAEGMQIMGSGSRTLAGENGEPLFGRSQGNFSHSKWEIPYFEGVDPCAWLRKCESKGIVRWANFTAEICNRFEGATNSKLNLIGEFKNIEQKGTVNEYLEQFEDLKAWVLIRNPTIPEDFFLEFFIEGLKEEIRHSVKLLEPYSFSKVVEKARHQENMIEFLNKKEKAQRNRGLTTNYSAQTIKAPNSSEAIETGEAGIEETEPYLQEEEVVDEAISLNALSGTEVPNTIKLRGESKKNSMSILLDSGSTHSFLDMETAKEMGCAIKETSPMRVTVANGNHVMSYHTCPTFKWKIQGVEFEDSVRLIRLGGNEMILGGDWMKKHNPILLDFIEYKVEVTHKGKIVELKWIYSQGELKGMSAYGVKQLLKKGKTVWAHLFTISATEEQKEGEIPAEISTLLHQYVDVFAEPTSLPPKRNHDHHIPLKADEIQSVSGHTGINFFKKNKIEKQVNEMLHNGLIQPSHSPFSSPVLLVKKKDGSWRFCIDYRELNNMTIKDKFPIPLVEDLMDELCGSSVYSKIDLRAGYHQIRMGESDIYKTAFRTHLGHYEFRVMPFGLTNAPATFQSLMNHVFQPYLRKFILVFFYDILVYSPSMSTHVIHLTKVLEVLRTEQLFAKLSKCSLGQLKVDYLGHIITREGVSTDPSKIEAMSKRPIPNSIKALRGFLGLTGYYRRFIKSYGIISKPLTNLLRKNAFQLNLEAEQAFFQLKKAMTTAPEGRPIAFFSKTLAPRHMGLSTYEKEYMAVLSVVDRWRHYLQGSYFIIKTDHHSLKYLLEQRVTTALQQKGLTKLLGLDYEIQYKRGAENKVADALSRRQEEESELCAVSTVDLHG
ncbi:PREDICTED: uncharacterized protein LOC109207079 [Nicotiana attenuata]|uniref:uncharacterized protein LOC109207079 n=1 Tax=Nicotiana attenuata TaxID=49451 RepID=UPI0009049A40|nr:PREDICTED: uncharacterized protein LOC109207079 [Nicotiana attenuata]